MHRRIALALLASLATTFLIAAVEFNYSGGFPKGIPWMVFFWLFLTALTAITSVSVAFQQRGQNLAKTAVALVIMALALWSWCFMFFDQLPCFLGGNGC